MAARPKTIDEYLAALNEDQRAALEKLRRTIRAVAPNARECISYGLAAFRLDGKALVAIGAKANHCAFYPMSSSTVAAHRRELEGYDTSKGTIRFPARKPLPAALVRKLVKARMAENARQSGKARRVESKLEARRKVPRVKSSSRPKVGGRSPVSAATKAPPRQDVDAVIASLKRSASKRTLDGMARYVISSDHAFKVGVMANRVSKKLRKTGSIQ